MEGVIKAREKTYYILNRLPSSWREWCNQQATINKPDRPDKLVAAIKAREVSLNPEQEPPQQDSMAVDGRKPPVRGGYKGGRKAEQNRSERHNRSTTNKNLTCYYCETK